MLADPEEFSRELSSTIDFGEVFSFSSIIAKDY